MINPQISSLALSLTMAVAAGLVGCFAVMRRMTLAADAISHVALPGIGVALLLRINPMIGALAMLMLGAVLIWTLERQTGITTETVTGVVFSVALAVGSMMTSGEQLIEALFGGRGSLSTLELSLGLLGSAAVIGFILSARNSLVVALVSARASRKTSGIKVWHRMNLAIPVGVRPDDRPRGALSGCAADGVVDNHPGRYGTASGAQPGRDAHEYRSGWQ